MDAVACLAEINNKRDFRPSGQFYKYLKPGSLDKDSDNSQDEDADNDSTSEVVEGDEGAGVGSETVAEFGLIATIQGSITGIKKVLNNPKAVNRLIPISFLWLCSTFCYQLIFFEVKYLHGDIFTNATTSIFSEIVAIALSGLLLETVGFLYTMRSSLVCAGVGMLFLLLAYTDDQKYIFMFILAAKFGACQF